MKRIDELPIENVHMSKLTTFDGFQIVFTVDNQTFQFLIGDTKNPIPLNIIHQFKEKSICPHCEKTIYAYPIGQQPCLYFRKNAWDLLSYFKSNYSEHIIL